MSFFAAGVIPASVGGVGGGGGVPAGRSKVGKVFIPQALAKAMKYGSLVLLQASIDTRIQRIVDEYKICDEQTFHQTDSILQSMQKVLGKKKSEQLRRLNIQKTVMTITSLWP